jgi:uncharacterized membrane protein YbhN (UPF0104 family)
MEFLRRRLGLILRTLVSAALIWWLLHKMAWSQLWPILQTVDVGWLALGFLFFTPVLLIVSWRWRMLLRVHGVRLKLWRVFELTMIGQFFSAFLLGTTGGDVIKIFYVARAVPDRRTAVSFTVIVDRVIGLVAMLLLGVALSFPCLSLLLSKHDTRVFTGIFYCAALGGVIASLGACAGPLFLRSRALRAWLQRLPFIHRAASLFLAYETTARAVRVNFLALIGSMPSQISLCFMGYCIFQALHLPGPGQHTPFVVFSAMLLMVCMLISLPISIGGLGVREYLFISYFSLLGIDREHAFAFSVTFFFLNMLWSLAGAPFYFLYRHETHTPAPVPEDVEPLFSRR